MALIQYAAPWTFQPQEAVEPHIGIPFHTLLTPVGGSAIEAATAGAAWRTIAGPLWTASGVSGVSRAVAPFGLALAQTGSDYFYRDNPISSGPRSWGMVFVPSSVSGIQGLWSIAATPNSGGPRFLLQRNGSDIRFYHSSGYRATFSGAAVVGRPVYIAWSLSDTFGGATCTMTVALNGEVQSYTGTTALASDAYEYLGNGYNGSAQGFYGEFWGVESELSSDQIQALSIEQSFWGGIYAPQTILVPVSAGAGGATNLIASDATHAHTLDAVVLTTSTALTVQDMAHGHALDAATLSTGTALTVADAQHAHALDGVTLSTTGATSLTVADSLHAHALDAAVLTSQTDLTAADMAHGHALDGVTLTLGGISLVIADIMHAHAIDAAALTLDTYLTVADLLHAHTIDNVLVSIPGGTLDLILKILVNRQELNPATGTFTLYDNDGTTVLYTTSAWADAAGTVPYSGGALRRIDALF